MNNKYYDFFHKCFLQEQNNNYFVQECRRCKFISTMPRWHLCRIRPLKIFIRECSHNTYLFANHCWQRINAAVKIFVATGYREQLNQVTAYIDSSFVYGSDVCEMNTLRSFTGGKLNVTKNGVRGKPLLPQITTHPECKSSSKVCFRAGEY
jgi:hypothetical protein